MRTCRYIFGALTIVLLGVGIMPSSVEAMMPWYNDAWTYRVKVTTNPAQIPSIQTSIPIYVDLGDIPAGIFSNAKGDGTDIVVTTSDGITKLDRDLVAFSTSTQTGELHVLYPTLDATSGTDIYIYYGNPAANEANTAAQVWNGYEGVWHLSEELPSDVFGMGVATMPAMDGGDGGWGVLYGSDPFGTTLDIAVDEDQIADAERDHTTEQMGYWIFKKTSTGDIKDSGGTIIGEYGKVTGLTGSSTTVSLTNTYANPVVVTTPAPKNTVDPPVVTRIAATSTTGFTAYLQNPGDLVTPAATDVYYIVMEAGAHTLPGGTKVEAGTRSITGTNENGNWNNTQMVQVTPINTYTTPVVLGQVMTTNDTDWSVFWNSNGNRLNPPTGTAIYIGKHVGADTDITRAAETAGYIIVEDSTGTTDGVDWIADVGADTIVGMGPGNTPPHSYPISGASSDFFLDATSNAFNGGLAGTITPGVVGRVGKSASLSGAVGSHIPLEGPVYSTANNIPAVTASFWLKTTQATRAGIFDWDRSDHWEIGLNFHNAGGQNGQISFDTAATGDGIRDLNSGTTVNDGNWHLVTTVFDNSQVVDKYIYIDGVLAASANQHTLPLGINRTRYGFLGDGSEATTYDGGKNNLPIGGELDEARIIHQALASSTILTQYNNQSDTTTFFTIGAEDAKPTAPDNLFTNHTDAQTGLTNPTDLELATPLHFSAIYNDPNLTDTLTEARIQVTTDPTFGTITHWDSGTTTIATSTQGARSTDMIYGSFGSAPSSTLVMDDGAITYYWRVAFVDLLGNASPFSVPGAFSLLDIPNPPAGVAATNNGSNQLTVTWGDTSTNEALFIIERRDDTGGGFGAWTTVATTTLNTVSYLDTTTVPNAAYQYRVSSQNAAGTSSSTQDLAVHYTTPTPPINVFGDYIDDTSFGANWTDQAILGTNRVEHCIGSTDCAAIAFTQIGGGLVATSSSPLLDNTGITPDEAFRWRARADNGVATSTYTFSPFEFTTPDAPTSTEAVRLSDISIQLAWADNSEYENGFRIEVSINGGAFTEITPGTNTVGANTTSYTYTGASAGNSYAFRVRAQIGATTNNAELLSSYATSSPVTTTPSTPTGLTASFIADNNLALSWTDTSSNESGFVLLVSENGGAYLPFATTTANTTSYAYTAGSSDSTYQFQIYSFVAVNPPSNPTQLNSSLTASNLIKTTPLAPTLMQAGVTDSTATWTITDTATHEDGFELNEINGTTLVKDIPVPNATTTVETSLTPNALIQRTLRSYVDNGGTKLYSAPSPSISIYTIANPPTNATGTPGLTSMLWSWNTNSNPAYTEFFAENITTGATFGWASTTAWTQTTLGCSKTYDFQVKARNGDSIETIYATTTASTSLCIGPSVGGSISFPGGGTTPATSTPPTPPTAPTEPEEPQESNKPVCEAFFTKNLRLGDEDLHVLELQRFLNKNGFVLAEEGSGSPGNETTFFGSRTYEALKRLQAAHTEEILTPVDLTSPSGYFGPSTRSLVNKKHCSEETITTKYQFPRNLRLGMTGDDVQKLQQLLNKNSFVLAEEGPGSPGDETTFFGARTLQAVEGLQTRYKEGILTPINLTKPTGYFGPSTRSFVNNNLL